MAVRFEEEDKELEEILEVGVEETLCYPYLAREDRPLVLGVECGNHTDCHQL